MFQTTATQKINIYAGTIIIAYEPPLQESVKYAEKLKFEGRYLEAVAAYERLIAKHPNNLELRAKIIKLHIFFGHDENTIVHIEKALKLSPDNPEIIFFKGLYYQFRSSGVNIPAALRYYLQSLQLSNKITSSIEKQRLQKEICRIIGLAYFNLGNIDAAIKYTEMALRIDPNFQKAKYNLGTIYLKKKGLDWKTYWNKAIEILKTIDQRALIRERAESSYEDYNILQLGRRLEAQIIRTQDYQIVKRVILSYPKERIPIIANAFWKYFIRYIPISRANGDIPYKAAHETVRNGFGACDAHVMLISDIFKSAGIGHFLIAYPVSDHVYHTGVVFNTGSGFNYISSDGLVQVNAREIKTLLRTLSEKSEIPSKDVFLIKIVNHRPVILKRL